MNKTENKIVVKEITKALQTLPKYKQKKHNPFVFINDFVIPCKVKLLTDGSRLWRF
jgi:hypothetical protein